MIRCNKCGFSNREQAETCIKCRTVLVKEDVVVQKNPVQVNKKTIQVTYEDREPWDHQGIAKSKRSFIEAGVPLNGDGVKAEKKPQETEKSKGASISDYFSDLNDGDAQEPVQQEESRFPEKSRFSETDIVSGEEAAGDPEEAGAFRITEVYEEKEIPEETEKSPAGIPQPDEPRAGEPRIGGPRTDSPLKNTGMPTVRRVVSDRRRSGSLVAISPNEEKELRTIDLEANEVLLDRETLDASNSSISRKGHANIFYLDGNWYIENMTPLKTTFVQVNQPVKLKDGDVILMGDSLFKFKQS